jgi:hypothetical protein
VIHFLCVLETLDNNTTYFQGTYEYLTNTTDEIAETDLVLLIDALDVWFQLSPTTLAERFEELGTSGVVTSAEINCCCWPWNFQAIKDVSCIKNIFD